MYETSRDWKEIGMKERNLLPQLKKRKKYFKKDNTLQKCKKSDRSLGILCLQKDWIKYYIKRKDYMDQ